MRYTTLLLAALAACSSSPTGPARHDPTVLITNQTDWPVHFQWRDGQGVAGADTVAGHVARCERFSARPDSAYFYADVTDPIQGMSTQTAPWFDPAADPAFTMVVTAQTNSSPAILTHDMSTGATSC